MRYPFRRRRFGQHFLHDPRIIDRIIEAIGPDPAVPVVEIERESLLTHASLAYQSAYSAVSGDEITNNQRLTGLFEVYVSQRTFLLAPLAVVAALPRFKVMPFMPSMRPLPRARPKER